MSSSATAPGRNGSADPGEVLHRAGGDRPGAEACHGARPRGRGSPDVSRGEFTGDRGVATIPSVTTDPSGRPHGVDADRILAQPLFASLTRRDAEEFVRYCEVRHVESGR